jgi:hypothetical protein
MPNSSDTFKTGEIAIFDGEYECLMCKQTGKTTVRPLQKGKIFPYCDVCGIKDGTYRLLAGKPARK